MVCCQPRKGEQGEWSVSSLGRGSRVNGLLCQSRKGEQGEWSVSA